MLPLLAVITLAALVSPIRVVDGDTVRAGAERIRLLGIDAPDDPHSGRCHPRPKPGAICNTRKADRATAALRAAITPRMEIERVGTDRYGRTLAVVWSSKANLSCWQLRRGVAVYRPEWDNGRRIRQACADAAR